MTSNLFKHSLDCWVMTIDLGTLVSIVYLFKKLSKYYPPKNGSFAKLFSELNAYWLLICFKRFFFLNTFANLFFPKLLSPSLLFSILETFFFFIKKNVKTKWPHVNSVWKQNNALPSIHIWFRLNYKCERFIRF